jgi:signal transduction histidine kinase
VTAGGWGWRRYLWLVVVSLTVLAVNVIYTDVRYELQPPFDLTPTWKVRFVSPFCTSQPECPREGDQIVAIGSVTREEQMAHPVRLRPFDDMTADSPAVTVRVIRDGVESTVSVSGQVEVARRILSVETIALFFWLTGILVLLWRRPPAGPDLLMVAILFCVSVVLTSGQVSSINRAHSLLVYRAAVHILPALLIHFYWVQPSPFRPRSRIWLPTLVYATALGLFASTLLPWSSSHGGRLVLWMSSAALLGVGLGVARSRERHSPGHVAANRLNLFGLAVGLCPLILVAALSYESSLGARAISRIGMAAFVLLLPLWPLSHLLSLARERLYEWRLERWLGGYAFWCIYGALLVVSYTLLAELWPRAVEREQLFLEVLVVFALLHHASRQLFRTFIERRVFGIRFRPERVFGLFAETIPSATDIHKFRAIVVSQLLPQLGILQSALVAGSGESSTLLYWETGETGETGEKEIDDRSLAGRLEGLSRLENLGAVDRPGLDWLRLLVPLRAGDRVVGTWLLGARDPDEFYPARDVEVLSTLASQLSPLIENMHLADLRQREIAKNQSLQEQLIQAQKMEAIGRLAAGVAHDFNNLLTILGGQVSLVERAVRGPRSEPQDANAVREYLDSLHATVERAQALVRQLLTFTRQHPLELEVSDLNSIVESSETMLEQLLSRGVDLTTRLEPGVPPVEIDSNRVTQILMNLVVNACDAMPNGGRVDISTGGLLLSEATRDACHTEVPPGAYATLRIADTGFGIDPVSLPHIFDPYFSTKPTGKGTGLGLAIVYGIARQHGGFVRLDGERDTGTAFEILFPEAEREPTTAVG